MLFIKIFLVILINKLYGNKESKIEIEIKKLNKKFGFQVKKTF